MVSQSPPTFFKVLIDASAPHLPLPQDFATYHLKNKIPKDPIIQWVNGGYSWKLKIEKVNEFYCFTHGWINVVKDVNLGFGDFLVFTQIDESIFKVLIFSPNGCQKDLPKKVTVQEADGNGDNNKVVDDDDVDNDNDDVDIDGKDVDGDEDDEEDGDAFFMPSMDKKNRSTLGLPAEFVRLSGINYDGSIQIKNLDGEEYPIALRSYKSTRMKRRYYLSTGWLDFRRINNLLDGDKYIVKFLKSEGKLCLAKIPDPSPRGKLSTNEVVKRKTGQSPPREHNDVVDCEDERVNTIKRPRGRPPKRQPGSSPQ